MKQLFLFLLTAVIVAATPATVMAQKAKQAMEPVRFEAASASLPTGAQQPAIDSASIKPTPAVRPTAQPRSGILPVVTVGIKTVPANVHLAIQKKH